MYNYKIIDSEYTEDKGCSYIMISTPLGKFFGYAFLHEDDKDAASKFLGCEIAERRAVINYLYAEIYNINCHLMQMYRLRKKIKKRLLRLNINNAESIEELCVEEEIKKYENLKCNFKKHIYKHKKAIEEASNGGVENIRNFRKKYEKEEETK